MIKCNVTVCGVIGRDASVRKNKEEKEFLVFPLRVQIPATVAGTLSRWMSARRAVRRKPPVIGTAPV